MDGVGGHAGECVDGKRGGVSKLFAKTDLSPTLPTHTPQDPTRDRIEAALDRLVSAGRDCVSVLVVGAPGGGKSALSNALLNERVAALHPLTRELERPVLAARVADLGGGGTARVTLIDTPGLADGDGPSPDAARALGGALAGRPLDAVLYVDRLDGYRVDESDVEVREGEKREVVAFHFVSFPSLAHSRFPSSLPHSSCASTPPTWGPTCGTAP